MHSSRHTSSRFEAVRHACLALLAGTLLAACSGGPESAPLMKATLKVQSITQSGNCEEVNIKASPVELKPNPPILANSHELITPVKLTKAADGVACTGQSLTNPMAPGKWKFSVMLPSDIVTCEREVLPGGEPITFKDGEQGCGGPATVVAAPDANAPAPAAPGTPPAGDTQPATATKP
jgi:hypothetical protein